MSRITLSVIVVLAFVALSSAAPKKRTRVADADVPPNGMKKLTKEERQRHPKHHPTLKQRAVGIIPDKFDSRLQWKNCKSISTIRNQGRCGTCWAVCGASVLSDRNCIVNGVQDFISSTAIAGCVDKTQSGMENCQAGGNPVNAFAYAAMYGVPTGGEFRADGKYTADDGCQPYFVGSTGNAVPVTCNPSCTNSNYKKATKTANDLSFVDSYWQATYDDNMSGAQIAEAVKTMQTEIMTRGPICIGITAWSDFQDWDPTGPPYCEPESDAQNKGGHAMRIVGWDRHAASNTPYWIVTNSWGASMGDKGVYKIAMNKNCVGIESSASAPIVKITNNCGSLCDKPLDQIVRTNPDDIKSPIYAFVDNCTVQVTIGADGKLTPVGAMSPTEKLFLGAPPGPIQAFMKSQDGTPVLINKYGRAGFCSQPAGSTKYQCQPGTATAGATCSGAIPGAETYTYYPDKANAIFVFPYRSTRGTGAFVDKLITDAFNELRSIVAIDSSTLQLCGLDKSNKPVCGAIKTSEFKSTAVPKKWSTTPGKMSTKC